MVATAEKTTVQVRPLMAKDLFTMAELITNSRAEVEQIYRQRRKPAKLHKLGEEPAEAEAPEDDKEEIGIAIIFALLGQAKSGIRPWLADMAQLKPQQFDELSLTQTIDVVEGIVRQEDWPAFLARLTGMFTAVAT